MNILTIPQYESSLRQKSSELPVEKISDPKLQRFLDDLGETMLKTDGAGLAAPQVDPPNRRVDQLVRIIAVNSNDQPLVMINPKIIKKSFKQEIIEEGCLSIPNVFGKVKRSKKIKVEYLDRQGQLKKLKAKNLLARVIQHEVDHLDGILFIDKIIRN